MDKNKNSYQRNFPVTWEQFHRDGRALAWRLLDTWVLFPWDSEITSNFVNPIINQNDQIRELKYVVLTSKKRDG